MSCPSAEQLARIAEGSLDAAALSHVEACPSCLEVIRIVGGGDSRGSDGAESFEASGSGRPAPGDAIGRYVVLRAVAQGGMGEVYLGYDPVLDRNLALKLVRSDRSSPDFAARLAREAQVLAKLAHPNVVRVFDAGTWRGVGYVAMEYLDGESLRTWCKTGERSTAEILRVFVGAARGIGAAHALGVVHRDIKPDNILVGNDGAGRIADFGLVATAVDRAVGGGTVGYRAPEVVAGRVADARSDQWSLCAALYEMLAGERPASTADLDGSRLSAVVVRALRRGLDADPSQRFATMDELADALQRRPHRVRYVVAAAALATIGVTAAILASHESDPNAACDAEGRDVVVAAAPLERDAFRHRFDVIGEAAELRRAATARELASYKTRLAASAVGACRARRVDPAAAALQRDCVSDRRRELAALVTALQTTDRAGLEQAMTAIAKLPDPALCAEPARLASIVPIDPARRTQAEQIADEVAALRSRFLLGERATLLPLARSLAERGERLGATVAVSTTGLLADMLSDDGQLLAASETHQAAARHAAVAHDDRTLALRLIRGAETAAGGLAFERASTLLAVAEIVASRLGDHALQDDLDAATIELALQRGDAATVIPVARALVGRLRDRHGRTCQDCLNSLYELARALAAAGQLDEARDVARTAIADITASFGPDHPDTATFHNHLAKIASELGHLDEARQAYEHTLAITRAAYGNDSPLTADALSNLAAILINQDRSKDAIVLAEQAVAIGERTNSRKLHVYLAQVSAAMLEMGNFKEGVPITQRELALREELYGADSPELIKPLLALGLVAAKTDDLETARRHWGRAVAIIKQMPAPQAYAVDLMRDLASILEDRRASRELRADADALERRIAARAKLASKR